MRRRISGEVVQGQPFCIGKNRPRLTFDGDGCRLNHSGGTAAAGRRGSGCRWIAPATAIRGTSGSCGATAGGDKHYYEDAKSDYERAFKKHCIFSLIVSTLGTRVFSLTSDLIRTPFPSLNSQQVTPS